MRTFLKYEAVAVIDRNAALGAVADALGMAGGWIVDHTLFSDVMATVRFALPGDRIAVFEAALAEAGLKVDPAPPAGLGTGGDELNGVIALTFANGTGDLRREVPAFS